MFSTKDFTAESDTETFKESTQLYRSLARRLKQLASGIKSCLEFVSNCILYLLGINHQMFCFSGSGDGDGASYQYKEAQFPKKTHKSKSCSNCLRNAAVCYHNENKTRLSAGSIQKAKGNVSGVATSSSGVILVESGNEPDNEPDTSDSETPCCFAVKRLRRLVKRRTKERHSSKDNDITEKSREQLFDSSCRGTTTENVYSSRKSSIEEMTEKDSLQPDSPAKDAEQCSGEQGSIPECKSYVKDVLIQATDQPIKTCTKIVTKAIIETSISEEKTVLHSLNSVLTKTNNPVNSSPVSDFGVNPTKAIIETSKTNEKTVLRSPKSVLTKTKYPVNPSPVSDFSVDPTKAITETSKTDEKTVVRSPKSVFTKTNFPVNPSLVSDFGVDPTKAITETSQTDEKTVLRSPKSVFTKTNVPVNPSPVSDFGVDPTKPSGKHCLVHEDSNYRETTNETEVCLEENVVNKASDKSEMENISSKPLETWEEKYLREVFNQEHDADEMKTKKFSTLQNVKRLYCITTQALRQRVRHRDEPYDEKIHGCRRSIKNYILNRDDKSDSQAQYFKNMFDLYDQFKKCAAERKHDISRFIPKAKNVEECKYIINTDKIMACAKRRLTPSDLREEPLTSIILLFQENSARTKQNETIDTKSDEQPFLTERYKQTPETKTNNPTGAKIEVQSYLSTLCGEALDANASFMSAIGSLSEHFTQHFTETEVPKETTVNQTVKPQLPEAASRKTEGKKSANFRIVHFDAIKSSVVSPKTYDKLNSIKDQTGKRTNDKTAISEKLRKPDKALMSPDELPEKETKIEVSADILIQQPSKSEYEEKSSHGEREHMKDNCKTVSMEAQHPKHSVSVQTVKIDIHQNPIVSKDVGKVIAAKQWQEFEVKKTPSKRNCVCIDKGTDNGSDGWKRTKLDEPKPELNISSKECQTEEVCNIGTDDTNPLGAGVLITTENIKNKEENNTIGKSEKKTPPPVPQKPTRIIKTESDFIDMFRTLQAETRLDKTLASARQPPPVPKKPDFNSRRAGPPAEEFRYTSPNYGEHSPTYSPAYRHRNDENNSFSPEKNNVFMFSGNTSEFGNDQRILQDVASSPKHQQEIVIQNSTGYEVILKHGRECFVPNILDFEFAHHLSDELIQEERAFEHEAVWHEYPEPDFRSRLPVEKEEEKYEEHFEIDTSVYDQSGCKIMPGSCTKVNRRLMEMQDKKKMKTKGVANKHLLKAFNDAAQGQDFCGFETDEDLQYLDEIYGTDDDVVEKYLTETDEEKDSDDKINEADLASDTVNVCYVEDVRHWEMLPTEVRRKNDDEEVDDKYCMSSKSTPDEKKKGKKKKEKKQKAQPMSLKELSFQFER